MVHGLSRRAAVLYAGEWDLQRHSRRWVQVDVHNIQMPVSGTNGVRAGISTVPLKVESWW